jgi:hypothetical protein
LIPNDTGLGVIGAEAMAVLKTRRRATIFFNLEIVNDDPRVLRLPAPDRANRSRTLRTSFCVVDQD